MMGKKFFCLSILILLSLASLAMLSVPVMSADGDVTFDLTYYYFSTCGIVPGVDPGGYVMVDVYVDASALPDKTPEGMRGWGLKVTVDPTVLTPSSAYGADAGYFLYDWSLANFPPPFPWMPLPYPPTFLYSVGADFLLCSEMFVPVPPYGAGGTGKLCTLYFESKSVTAYTELTVGLWPDSGYVDATNTKYAINQVDGHYNMPPNGCLFETPVGGMFPTGDPTGSDWHELEPSYCEQWSLESWTDNGDGVLSPSDQIAMIRASAVEPVWFHVEWVSPAPVAGDGIAEMFVTEKILPPIPPLASFTFSPAEPVVGETVTFDASASYDPNGIIVSHDWDFGDDTYGSGETVEHAYSEEETFTIILTVTDNDELTDTVTAPITVIHRVLSIKLCGEHDYSCKEEVNIRLAALVKDVNTMEPVLNVDVTIEIYCPNGTLWVSNEMIERLVGTGIYEWESDATICELKELQELEDGIYLVYAQASCHGVPMASDILEFHIDPPSEGTVPLVYYAIAFILLVGVAGTVLLRKLRQTSTQQRKTQRYE